MFDMAKMMKQAQDLQKKMESAQAELDNVLVVGEAGNGAVKITMTAKMAVKNVEISAEAPDDKELLADMIQIALEDAGKKATEATKEKMQNVTGGMNIPGLKLPF